MLIATRAFISLRNTDRFTMIDDLQRLYGLGWVEIKLLNIGFSETLPGPASYVRTVKDVLALQEPFSRR